MRARAVADPQGDTAGAVEPQVVDFQHDLTVDAGHEPPSVDPDRETP